MSLSGRSGVVYKGVCVCCDAGDAGDDISAYSRWSGGVNDHNSNGTYEFRRKIFSPLPP